MAMRIGSAELETEGEVPSIAEAHFIEHAEEARPDAPSPARGGVEKITLTASPVS